MSKVTIYLDVLSKVLHARKKNEKNRGLIKQNVFYGVKIMNLLTDPKNYDDAINNFQFASAIKQTMSLLTPGEFMNVFPIEKDFKGHKWEMKDYFYTKDYINTLDQDKPIGEEISELLWEYQNWEITFFVVEIMSLMSKISRLEGKSSLAEKWATESGIKTYTLHEDEQGKEFLFDKETGKTTKVKKPRPKHLRVVK